MCTKISVMIFSHFLVGVKSRDKSYFITEDSKKLYFKMSCTILRPNKLKLKSFINLAWMSCNINPWHEKNPNNINYNVLYIEKHLIFIVYVSNMSWNNRNAWKIKLTTNTSKYRNLQFFFKATFLGSFEHILSNNEVSIVSFIKSEIDRYFLWKLDNFLKTNLEEKKTFALIFFQKVVKNPLKENFLLNQLCSKF